MSEVYWAPWPKPPLSMNQRIHHFTRAKLAKEIRAFGRKCGVAFSVKYGIQNHLIVRMVWIVPDRRIRDADNPFMTLKSFADGVADSGIVPGDHPELMTKPTPFIVYQKGVSKLYFEIEATNEQPAYTRINLAA